MGIDPSDIQRSNIQLPAEKGEQKKRSKKRNARPEGKLQEAAVQAFRLKWRKMSSRLFAIPNGGYRNAAEAAVMKNEGVTAGVWDLFLAVPIGAYAGCFIETKTPNNSLTASQKQFRRELQPDYCFFVYRSVDEFMDNINWYLSGKL